MKKDTFDIILDGHSTINPDAKGKKIFIYQWDYDRGYGDRPSRRGACAIKAENITEANKLLFKKHSVRNFICDSESWYNPLYVTIHKANKINVVDFNHSGLTRKGKIMIVKVIDQGNTTETKNRFIYEEIFCNEL